MEDEKAEGQVEKSGPRILKVPQEGEVPLWCFLCGFLGCLCFGGGDWLMLYGNPMEQASLRFLMSQEQWRLNLAMGLAFPGILFYGIALFALSSYLGSPRLKKIYSFLNVFGLTPWLALHLFYILILTLFSWMSQNGLEGEAIRVSEGVFSRLSWIVPVSEAFMLPVFAYFLALQLRGRLFLPRYLSLFHVFPMFALLKGLSLCLPMGPFRMGFTNGLMSESMALWFLSLLWWERRRKRIKKNNNK